MKKIKLLLSLVVSFNSVMAGDVDLSISIDIEDFNYVVFDQTTNFSITISNNGPDDAGGSTTANYPVAALTSIIYQDDNGYLDIYIRQNVNVQQDCFFVLIIGDPLPGGVVSYAFSIGFPVIPANSSLTCHGTYHIGFEQGSRELNFRAASPTDNELNTSDNNTQTVIFAIQPRNIPTLSFYSILLLLLLVIVIVYYKLKNHALH